MFSHVGPFATTCSLSGSSVHRIFQARIKEQVAITYSKGSSQLRDQTHIYWISCFGRWVLYHCTTWEAFLTPTMLLAKGKRNLEAGIVRSYKCVDLSLSIVLWTVRRALCDLVGFSVTSLALFVPQRDYIPATHASSGPLNLLLCLQELDTTDWLTHTHTLPTTHRQSKVWAVFQSWTRYHCHQKVYPDLILLSLDLHCTFCLFPLLNLSRTQSYLSISLFLTLCLLFLTNHSAQFLA